MTVGIVAAAIVFWPAAPLFLLMHGKDITFPKGIDVPTFVNGEMKLDPAKFQVANGNSAPAAGATASNLAIGSTPAGADIYLDQNFVGNTPSTINVPAGKHAISVRKAGFQDWGRDMNLSGGSISLNAELVPGASGAPATAASTAQVTDLSSSDTSVAEAARLNRAAKAKATQQPQH